MGRRAAYLKDVLLWAVLGLPALWAGLTHTLADRYTRPEVIAGLAAIGVAVALARSRPLAAMLVAAALWAGSVAVRGDPTVFFVALSVMSYLAGVRMARARPALLGLSATAVTVAVVVPLVRWGSAGWDPGAWFFSVTGIALFGLVPWLAGHARHQSLALTRAGWERAGHLERERRMLAERARLRERAGIAREMHDLLGHDLSLVALRIGALEVAPGLSERHREAAGEARRAVTAAAERLRDVVAVLRDGDAPDPGETDQPEESVAELVRRAGTAGMPVTLHGAREEARIPPSARTLVRRVVREGLTNAAKHAPGARVTVRLACPPGETAVSVANTAPERPGRGVTGGYGLRALAERVRLQGGSLHGGPTGGGFTLTVRVPHAAPRRDGLPALPEDLGEPSPRRPDDTPGPDDAPGPGRGMPDDGLGAGSRAVEQDLASARRRVRRTRLAAALVSLAAAGGVAAFVLGFMVYEAATSVLPPAEFARLRAGQAESEVAAVLPARTRVDDPSWPEPPIPPGARCHYYSATADPFRLDLYRLCFARGRLVEKSPLPR